jgi:hypothetical protein
VLYEEKRAGDPETLPGIADGRPFDPWFSYPTAPENSKAILLNLEGKRYIDESDPVGSKYPRLVQSILEQRRGRVIVVGDQALVDAGRNIADQIKLIEEQKGFVIKANSVEEFAQELYKAFGVPVANVVRTINEYNNAIATNTASELEVSRLNGQFPLTTPPYYGILAVPGLYDNFGGVAINTNAQVLDRHRDPIPGLYAVPPCAGDVMREMYGGGIGAAGTFGYIAGKHISAS